MAKTQKRITGRPKPMIPKGGVTITKRLFKCGGKKTK